jgi:hypothetical protein
VKLSTQLHLAPKSRMRGAILPLPKYVFMAWYLVKYRDNFTFTLPHITYSADTSLNKERFQM